MLQLTLYPDPILTTPSVDIKLQMDYENGLVYKMLDLMRSSGGIGLSAPQIGQNIKIFVTEFGIFYNPRIVQTSGLWVPCKEGCLSIPGFKKEIHRPENVLLQYIDEKMVKKTNWFNGIKSRIIQHEMDHLKGKLINQ